MWKSHRKNKDYNDYTKSTLHDMAAKYAESGIHACNLLEVAAPEHGKLQMRENLRFHFQEFAK